MLIGSFDTTGLGLFMCLPAGLCLALCYRIVQRLKSTESHDANSCLAFGF